MNAKTYLNIMKFPLIVFVVFIISTLTNLHAQFPELDMLFHIAGGASIALAALTFIKELQKSNKLGKINFFSRFLFVVSLVALAAVLWEFAEFLIRLVSPIKLIGSLEDTLLDLACGLLGGAITALLRK